MTDTGKNRLVVFLLLLMIGLLYAVPKMIEGYRMAYAKGAEIRASQGR